MHLVMFDIDGTLVDSEGFDAELYVAAVEAETGVVVDRNWDRYEHVSDSGVLEQLLRERRLEAQRDALVARVQRRFVGLVRDYLRRSPLAVREIAGAKRLVERLVTLPNARVAIATGGWAETARLKLAHVGIDAARLGFASSSDAHARTDIMRLAAQRAMRGAVHTRDVLRRRAMGPPCECRARVRFHRRRPRAAASDGVSGSRGYRGDRGAARGDGGRGSGSA